jgi:DNA polymerase-3 subunit gamma/tau
VVFVLATTDPQKVLPTIRSRTQHFEFTLLSHVQLVGHLTDILQREGVEADAEAVDLVARRASGSARDALSLLDQALAVGGGRLDAQQVQAAFGGAPFDLRLAVLEAAAHDDVAGALVAVHDLVASGHDVRRVADDLLRTLRDAFLQANASGRVPYDGPPEECERLAALAKELGNPSVVRAIEILGDAIVDIRGQAVADPRLVLEVAVVRIARHEARTREETLLDRVERLEQRLNGGGAAAPPAPAAASGPAARPRPAPAPGGPMLARRERTPKPASEPPTADGPSGPQAVAEPDVDLTVDLTAADPAVAVTFALDDVIEAWPATLALLKAPLRAFIQDAQPIALEDGVVVFGVPKVRFDMINERFRKEAAAIKEAFASRLGGSAPRFKLKPHDFDAPGALRPPNGAAAAAPSAEGAGEGGRSRGHAAPRPRRRLRRPERARRRPRRATGRLGQPARRAARRRGRRGTPARLSGGRRR